MIYTILVAIVTAAWGAAYSYASHRNQLDQGWWTLAAWGVACLAPWAFLSRWSANLMRDGMVFDAAIALSFYATLCVLRGGNFSPMQWVFAVIFLVGVVGFSIVSG